MATFQSFIHHFDRSLTSPRALKLGYPYFLAKLLDASQNEKKTEVLFMNFDGLSLNFIEFLFAHELLSKK